MLKTIEYPSVGYSYHENRYGVYAYDHYPEGSVNAGMTRRTFVDAYDTYEEAKAAHPDAGAAPCGYTFAFPVYEPYTEDDAFNDDYTLTEYDISNWEGR
jgi:hypothetical protein